MCAPHFGQTTPRGLFSTGAGRSTAPVTPPGTCGDAAGSPTLGVATAPAVVTVGAAAATAPSGLPQFLQNFIPVRFAVPQLVQETMPVATAVARSVVSGDPHCLQNFHSGWTSKPHRGQCERFLLSVSTPPQALQNLAVAGSSILQFGQYFILLTLYTDQRTGALGAMCKATFLRM